MCGQLLSDPESVHLGIGPECRVKEAELASAKARFVRGARVIVDAPGWREVHGVVSGFHAIRKGRRSRTPVTVRLGALGVEERFAIDQVRLVEEVQA
jgi:hypothetical protein